MSTQRKVVSNYIFMSAELATLPKAENAERTAAMRKALKGAAPAVRDVEGCYAGTTESSFWVTVSTPAETAACIALARQYGQESILFVHPETYAATLSYVHTDGSLSLGTMRSIRRDVAESKYSDAYTLIPGTDWALICE